MLPNHVKWLAVKNTRKERDIEFMDQLNGIDNVLDPNMPSTIAGQVGKGSYHHALALNKACKSGKLTSRFVLFLDPDFFIVPSLEDCINYMLSNDLAFFGAPYMLEAGKKRIQGFPVAFCMFIDTSKVPITQLDFTPEPLEEMLADTGYKIYKRFVAQSPLKFDAATPPKPDFKTTHKYSNDSLSSAYGVVPNIPLDEYFWNGKLFGLHCHMKLHLRSPEEVIRRSKQHCKEIHKIVDLVRKYDSAI